MATTAHDNESSLRGSVDRGVVPDPAGTTTHGPTATAVATDATGALTLQALFTQSTYPD
jgi:hypothetical protein